MGGALLEGWIEQGINPHAIAISDPQFLLPRSLKEKGVQTVTDIASIENTPSIIIFAVKPQILGDVLPLYGRFAPKLYLSIAAGKNREFFRRYLGKKAPIVRAMPNTPAAIGRGMTVIHRAGDVDPHALHLAEALLKGTGDIAWIEDEDWMHIVTAVSGGGPAYLFLLIEALTAAGHKAGLPLELAQKLARKTMEGSAELSRLSPEKPEDLRRAVTSPKGTTEAALHVLMKQGGLQQLMEAAIQAATARSYELSEDI